MTEQSVNGPEYLARNGWKRHESEPWWCITGEPLMYSFVQAENEQHARDAAALDRVLALCGDRERLKRLSVLPGLTYGYAALYSAAYEGASLLAAEITRLVGAHGASGSGEESDTPEWRKIGFQTKRPTGASGEEKNDV